MRRISNLSVLCLAAGVMTACALPDEVVTTENIPTAGVRFINAVPDTMAVDFRFTDMVESNAHFRIGFRASPVSSGGAPASTQVQYKNARAGLRKFSVFLDDTTQAVAQLKLLSDSTFQFDAGKNYTVMMWGSARSAVPAQKMRFDIWEEAIGDSTPNVPIRLINATNTAIDAWSYHSDSATAQLVGTPRWSVAGMTVGSYVTFAAHATSGGNPRSRRFRIVASGAGIAGNPYVTCPDPSALVGSAASADIEALPGTTVGGSALTGIIFPGSDATSKAVQFNTTTGATSQIATAAGYESARSYITDGFCQGQTVFADTGWAAANEGNAVITSVTNGSTTTTTPSGTGANSSRNISATATGYARVFQTLPSGGSSSAGSFLTDGFAVGHNVTAAGFTKAGVAGGFATSAGSNNGVSLITAVTATTMTVTKTEGTQIEAGVTGTIAMGATAGALTTTGGTYTRSAGSFLADGFFPGQAISVAGFAAAVGALPTNNGSSTIVSISADGLSMTVSKATGMINEASAAGRSIFVSTGRSIVGFGRMAITGGRTVETAGANVKTLTVSPPPPGIAFVWDRRPPRTACSPLC